jgi:hypothetical protein
MARVVIVNQLRKPQRAGHARRPTADDDDIGWHLRMLDVRKRLAEDQHLEISLLGETLYDTRNQDRRRIAIALIVGLLASPLFENDPWQK